MPPELVMKAGKVPSPFRDSGIYWLLGADQTVHKNQETQ